MKTKFLKLGLPLAVFMLAIVFAFASNSTSKAQDTSLALVPGYIFQDGKCQQVATCSTVPGPLCMVGTKIARNKINETQCGLEQLYHWSN
ncbi:hypothetical protein GGR32_002319 [Mesonia hippocampi]|uniref:Secreted protein n=1 Tax=Mesonia hippocampi TaxID=1628250 RepID=A0A840EYX3_9FLAO|nr:DUF6520 family protein [Mesonia hippocampi]MBB4120007.1 hypothetical protein [Mesonia hippocampi]